MCVVLKRQLITFWEIILNLVGVQWTSPRTVIEAIFSWRGSLWGRKEGSCGYLSLCIFWSVLKVRNSIVFRDEILDAQRLKCSFAHRLSWNTNYLGNEATSFIGFCRVDGLPLRTGEFFVFGSSCS